LTEGCRRRMALGLSRGGYGGGPWEERAGRPKAVGSDAEERAAYLRDIARILARRCAAISLSDCEALAGGDRDRGAEFFANARASCLMDGLSGPAGAAAAKGCP